MVVTQVNHKKRMVIEFSKTINKFTLLDAYPLPHMNEIANKIAQYKRYSTLDQTTAYHQVEIPPFDHLYTVFRRIFMAVEKNSIWTYECSPLLPTID